MREKENRQSFEEESKIDLGNTEDIHNRDLSSYMVTIIQKKREKKKKKEKVISILRNRNRWMEHDSILQLIEVRYYAYHHHRLHSSVSGARRISIRSIGSWNINGESHLLSSFLHLLALTVLYSNLSV